MSSSPYRDPIPVPEEEEAYEEFRMRVHRVRRVSVMVGVVLATLAAALAWQLMWSSFLGCIRLFGVHFHVGPVELAAPCGAMLVAVLTVWITVGVARRLVHWRAPTWIDGIAATHNIPRARLEEVVRLFT
jgi:hypothetical protein